MAIQRQTTWGSLVTLDMFFGGIGAGIFPVCFMLFSLNKVGEVALIGMLLGPILVIVGLFFLLAELGSPGQAYRVLTGMSTSWMSRGALLQALYIVFGFGYAIPALLFTGWAESGLGLATGIIALVLALVTAVYHGLFLSKARGIALWSSAVLPLAFFLTALGTGLGLILPILLAYTVFYTSMEMVSTLSILGIAGIAIVISQLIIIWSLLSLRPGITYTESVKTMGGLIVASIICLILSLVLLASGLWVREISYLMPVSAVSGILLLASGFIIRSSIIRAGHYYPLEIRLSTQL